LASAGYDPLGMTVVHELEESLSLDETMVVQEVEAGYTENEAVVRLGAGHGQFRKLRQVVREKAIEHLA